MNAAPPGPFLPAGLPPGSAYATDDRPPEGVTWFRIYAVVACVLYGLVTLLGLAMMVAPLFAPRTAGDEAGEVTVWLAGLFYGLWGLAVLTPTLIVLFSGRRPWVHTLGTLAIGVGMFSCCCLPVLIPLIIVWMKPETKRWFGAR